MVQADPVKFNLPPVQQKPFVRIELDTAHGVKRYRKYRLIFPLIERAAYRVKVRIFRRPQHRFVYLNFFNEFKFSARPRYRRRFPSFARVDRYYQG